MNAQTLNTARTFLHDWPRLTPTAAILQLAAMLALDWQAAESVYNLITGA